MSQPLPSYPDYKPAGLPWLAEVPAHWKMRRIKTLLIQTNNGVWGEDPDESNVADHVVCVRVADFDRLNLKVSQKKITIRAVSQSHQTGRLLNAGDILLEKSGGGEKEPVGRAVLFNLKEKAVCSNFVARIVADSKLVSSSFLVSMLDSLQMRRLNMPSIKQTTGIQNLDEGHYFSNYIPLPPLPEQQRIVAFLDGKTRQIARLLRNKRQLIKLLTEQKQALIHRAVTQGLNPDAPRKDSGVAWLGEVPAHWEVKRLKNIVERIDQGVSPQAVGFLADGDSWGVLKSGCVNHGQFRETEHKKLADDFTFDPSIAVAAGDVLISRACGSPSLVGSVGKIKALNYQLILSDKLFRPVFKKFIDPDFIVYISSTRYYRDQVEQAISVVLPKSWTV